MYPHIETKADYDRYEVQVEQGLEGLSFVCVDGDGEGHFSWTRCDVCDRDLGGDRFAAHGVDINDDIVHLEVCQDCMYYITYGKLDDMTMMDMEEEEKPGRIEL